MVMSPMLKVSALRRRGGEREAERGGKGDSGDRPRCGFETSWLDPSFVLNPGSATCFSASGAAGSEVYRISVSAAFRREKPVGRVGRGRGSGAAQRADRPVRAGPTVRCAPLARGIEAVKLSHQAHFHQRRRRGGTGQPASIPPWAAGTMGVLMVLPRLEQAMNCPAHPAHARWWVRSSVPASRPESAKALKQGGRRRSGAQNAGAIRGRMARASCR